MRSPRLPILLAALALATTAPGHAADQRINAKGTGTIKITEGTTTLTCVGPLHMVFEKNATNGTHLIEFWETGSAPSGGPEAQANCAVTTPTAIDIGTASMPKHQTCLPTIPTQFGTIRFGEISTWPWAFSGNGTQLSPYVFQQIAKLCSGATITDKITFWYPNGTTINYKHDFVDPSYQVHVTATLTRM